MYPLFYAMHIIAKYFAAFLLKLTKQQRYSQHYPFVKGRYRRECCPQHSANQQWFQQLSDCNGWNEFLH